jgi:hypothetical protein
VVGVNVSDEDLDAVITEPRDHRARCLLGIALTLVRGRDGPCERSRLSSGHELERGLHRAYDGSHLAMPKDPVEPALRSVVRPSRDLAHQSGPQLLQPHGPTADEVVQALIVENRSELVGVCDAQGLERQPKRFDRLGTRPSCGAVHGGHRTSAPHHSRG